jgi:hypothetical protein
MPHNHPAENLAPPEPDEVNAYHNDLVIDGDRADSRKKTPPTEAELKNRAKFILESLIEPTKNLLLVNETSPELVPGMLKAILLEKKLKKDPQLSGVPASEDDVRLTIALLAEAARRNAEARGDEIKEKAARDLIVDLIGVNPTLIGNMLHEAILEKVNGNSQDPDYREVMDLAEKKGL